MRALLILLAAPLAACQTSHVIVVPRARTGLDVGPVKLWTEDPALALVLILVGVVMAVWRGSRPVKDERH
jgi:hypothetical protein